MKRVPNYLTFLRLGLVPFFVLLMLDPTSLRLYLAAAVFVLASATDFLDGYIARRYGAVSDLGKLLDPLADKLLVMAALVMLLAQRMPDNGEPWIPGWMVAVILARDTWVTGLRAIAGSHGVVVAAIDTGKVKSFLQMVAIVCILLRDIRFPFEGVMVSLHVMGLYLLFFSLAFAIWSAVEYTSLVLPHLNPSGDRVSASRVPAGQVSGEQVAGVQGRAPESSVSMPGDAGP